jgi:hypothetical protein
MIAPAAQVMSFAFGEMFRKIFTEAKISIKVEN